MCCSNGFQQNKDSYIYFLHQPEWRMLQIGITNDPKQRMYRHGRLGWQPLEIVGPFDGKKARPYERKMLRYIKSTGANLKNKNVAGKFHGYTEAWLEEEFTVSSLVELSQLAGIKDPVFQ